MWRADTLLITERNLFYRGDGNVCSICLESEFTKKGDNQLITLLCGHNFHLKCILDWLKFKNNCPNCRQVIMGDKSFPEKLQQALAPKIDKFRWSPHINMTEYPRIPNQEEFKELVAKLRTGLLKLNESVDKKYNLTLDERSEIMDVHERIGVIIYDKIQDWNRWKAWIDALPQGGRHYLSRYSDEADYWASLYERFGNDNVLHFPSDVLDLLDKVEEAAKRYVDASHKNSDPNPPGWGDRLLTALRLR